MTHDELEGIDNIGWTVYGKIRSIGKNDGTQIGYAYDPSGNRVSKTVNGVTTWYIRDAQGNTMGLYDNQGGGSNWKEQHLYGSSRLGIWRPNLDVNNANGTTAWDTTGNKSYELVNHLGNVMATISDKRLQHSSDGATIDWFDADVQSAQEYYAFGAPMRVRSYSAGKPTYRYGFNGKENDNEVKKDLDGNPNVGTQQDYGMRIYDPRLGRFLSVDPLIKQYPWYTPYQFAGNTPIQAVDLDGGEPKSIVNYNPITGFYKFTKPALTLLNLVSGVPVQRISEVDIKTRSQVIIGTNNGALTSVDRIQYDNDYFNRNNYSYGMDSKEAINNWLDISSHEVRHLPQADKYGNSNFNKAEYFISFLGEYAKEYTKTFDMKRAHDNAPREVDAEKGAKEYENFNRYLDSTFGNETILNLFKNDKLSDDQKSDKLKLWFKIYKESQKATKEASDVGFRKVNVK